MQQPDTFNDIMTRITIFYICSVIKFCQSNKQIPLADHYYQLEEKLVESWVIFMRKKKNEWNDIIQLLFVTVKVTAISLIKLSAVTYR